MWFEKLRRRWLLLTKLETLRSLEGELKSLQTDWVYLEHSLEVLRQDMHLLESQSRKLETRLNDMVKKYLPG